MLFPSPKMRYSENLFVELFEHSETPSWCQTNHPNEILPMILLMSNVIATKYHQTFNISHTKKKLNVSFLIFQVPLPNPLKPGIKSTMKMQLEQHQ